MMRARNCRSRSSRRASGISLVETVVVMAVAAAMFGLAVKTIHVLLRADRYSGQALRRSTTVSRLSRRWRDDVHAARAAEIAPVGDAPQRRLALTGEGARSVDYRIEEHQLTRVERRDDDVHSRAVFYLPPGSTLRFEREQARPALLRLVVRLAPRSVAAARRTPVSAESGGRGSAALPIEAVVGRDHRFGRAMNEEGGVRNDEEGEVR